MFELRDDEGVGDGAEDEDCRYDKEGSVEALGGIDDVSRHPACGYTGEVAEAVLEAGPFTGGSGAGHGLGAGPVVGGGKAKGEAGEEEEAEGDVIDRGDACGVDHGAAEQAGDDKGFADEGGCVALGDEVIGEPAADGGGDGDHDEGEGAEDGHLLGGEAALLDEVEGIPGDHEVPTVVEAEKADEGAPDGAGREELTHGRFFERSFLYFVGGVLFGGGAEPEGEPDECAEAEDHEEAAPAVIGDDEAADQGAECGAEFGAGVDEAVGFAALIFGEVFSDDFGEGRVGDGFADAEEEAEGEEGGEGGGEAGEGGGERPEEIADGEDAVDVVTLDEPAGGDLAEGIGPEEGGGELAHHGRGDLEFVADFGGRHAEVAAVDVVDEDGDDEEGEEAPLHRGLSAGRGGRNFWR